MYIYRISCIYNIKFCLLKLIVAEVGFESSLYKVIEGEEMNVRVCVLLLSGQLSDAVSLNYSLSLQPGNATGELSIMFMKYKISMLHNRM